MMVDPCIYGMADPVSADIGGYICPVAAVFSGGECGATESVFLFGLPPVYKELFQISHRFEFTCS